MSTEQIWDIPYVRIGYLDKNAIANILFWLKCIKLGMDPDYFMASKTFVLYYNITNAWVFACYHESLYVCYTKDMVPLQLPSHFVRDRDVVVVSIVAQNTAKYTKRRCWRRCWPSSSHDLYRETTIRDKSFGDLKSKETRRSPKEVKVEHVERRVRTELVLHVDIMFVQGLPFLICVATSLDLLTCIF